MVDYAVSQMIADRLYYHTHLLRIITLNWRILGAPTYGNLDERNSTLQLTLITWKFHPGFFPRLRIVTFLSFERN